MRRAAWVIAVMAACKPHGAPSAATPDAAAPATFEGELDVAMVMTLVAEEPETRFDYVVEIKGHKARSGIHGSFATLVDGDAKKSWSLDPAERTYRESDVALDETTHIDSTTKSLGADTVAGTPCERWEIDELGNHTTFCLAPSLRLPFTARAAPSGFVASIERDRLLEKGFPLREETRAPDGRVTFRMDTTRIVARAVADTEFEIPSGYTKGEPMPLHLGSGGGSAP